MALASGSFSNTHSFGIEGTGQIEFSLHQKLKGVTTSGFIAFNGKSNGTSSKYVGLNIIPLKVGVKYYLTEGIYCAGQVG